MKTMLLTGSSGFIGNYFINKYENKYDIKIFSFRNDDFEKLHLNDVDVVVHLSALVHQVGGASYEEYEKVNITQTLKLANKAKKEGVGHFVFMSTVKVYGEETEVAYNEDSLCKPQDDYGKTKLKAENELLKLQDENFKVSIVRTPIVYGYGVKANIKNLINLIKKVPVLPFGNIKNKRSMVYIGNLTHLIDEIIIQQKDGVFLASDNESISTAELIALIAKELNKKTILVKTPLFDTILKKIRQNIYKRLFKSLEVDNSKTKKVLNLKNPYTLEEGIRYMIKGEN